MPDFTTVTAPRVMSRGGVMTPGREQDFVDHMTTSTTYVLANSYSISTPTIPAGLTILKYMLAVSLKFVDANLANIRVRIEVNGVIEWDELGTAAIWLSRSMEVAAGTYNVDIYIRTTVAANPITLDENFGAVGVGSDTSSLAIAAYITTGGLFRCSARYMIAEGVPDVTVACRINVDLSTSDVVDSTLTEATGYADDDVLSYTAYATVRVGFLLSTTLGYRPAFLMAAEIRGEKGMV